MVATGRLSQRSYEKDGEKRTVIEMEVDEIGPSLKFASAKVTKASRDSGNGGRSTAKAGRGGGDDSEPPF